MKRLTTAGRIIFAIPFALFGVNHFINWELMADIYISYIPIGVFTSIITGIVMVLVSLSLIFKKYITLNCLILAILLFIFIVTIHIPQLFSDDNVMVMMALTHLLKDMSLMGGALLIAGLSSDQLLKK